MTNSQPTTAFPPGTWAITPDTSITLTVKLLKMIDVTATLGLIDGTVAIAPDGTPTGVTANVDATSFASGIARRDEHIASDDFLDSTTYPLITFSATQITTSQPEVQVGGTVTVRGVDAPLVLTVTDITIEDTTAELNATAMVDRSLLGVSKFPSFVIGHNVAVSLGVHLSVS
ncbi:MAG: YceI family protein [Actinomycetota bacterium]